MSTAPARFADLGVPSDLCARLDAAAITEPFPIQSAVIPDALAGRDVAGRAPTGSGKTLAFGLPLVARLRPAQRRRPTALVLAPTRELAEQITSELRPFVRRRRHDVVSVYGGVGYGPQRKALDAGAELVVACPGRLEDLIQSGLVSLGDVDQVVVDEADRMADMGFLPAVRRILELTSDAPPGADVLRHVRRCSVQARRRHPARPRHPRDRPSGPRHLRRPPRLLAGRPDRARRGHGGRDQDDGLDDRVLPDAPRCRSAHQAARQARRDGDPDPRRPQPAPARPRPARVRPWRGALADRNRRRRPRCARRRCRRRRPLRSAAGCGHLRPPVRTHGPSGRDRRRRLARRAVGHALRPPAATGGRHRRRHLPRRPRRTQRHTAALRPRRSRRAAPGASSSSSTAVAAMASSTAAPASTCSSTTRTCQRARRCRSAPAVEFAVRPGRKGDEAHDVTLV